MPSSPNVGSLKERFGALRTLRPFIAMVWRTSPPLTVSSLLLRLVRALLPVVTLYIGKLIIDDVVQLVQMPDRPATFEEWLKSGLLNWLGVLLLAEFALAILSDVLGRIVELVDSLLSERVTNASSVSLMEHAATLDLEDFEDAEFQDQLERARRQTSGRLTLMSPAAGPGAGHRDGRELRRRLAGLRAVADRAAAGGAAAGVPGRSAFQRPDLYARLRPHAGAARARLCAPDRGQRRDRQGSEDLRPEPLPDRSLQQPGGRLLRGQPPARAAACHLGRRCSPRSAPSAITSPMPTSPGAPWPASSRSATSPSSPDRSAACAPCSRGC